MTNTSVAEPSVQVKAIRLLSGDHFGRRVVDPLGAGGAVGEVEHVAGAQVHAHEERLVGQRRVAGEHERVAVGRQHGIGVRAGVAGDHAVAPVLGPRGGELHRQAVGPAQEDLLERPGVGHRRSAGCGPGRRRRGWRAPGAVCPAGGAGAGEARSRS